MSGLTSRDVRACLPLDRQAAHDEYMDPGRIIVDHQIRGGVPCVAGTRIPVATVVGLVANGLTTEEIIAEYPQLSTADVQACLGYAARAVDERELPVRSPREILDRRVPPGPDG
jgi:uncharacterized protein (DUF433 family)